MSTFQLFNIYHSFLLKKWYVLVYVVLLLLSIIVAISYVAQHTSTKNMMQIGVVDEDKSRETQMIIKTFKDGEQVTQKIAIQAYTSDEAQRLLEKKKIVGFLVFEKGMTAAFYKNGELPIRVHTYDNTSMMSIAMNELSDSIYKRLVLAEGGIVAFKKLQPEATDDELIAMMTNLLFVGLDRQGTFQMNEIETYDTASYAVVSLYFICTFLFFLSIFTILKMDAQKAMRQRLTMFHFAKEKLLLARVFLATIYTALFMTGAFFLMKSIVQTPFASYNTSYMIQILAIYIVAIALLYTIIELIKQRFVRMGLKTIVVIAVILLSGAVIPSVYMTYTLGDFMNELLFSQLFHALLALFLTNYNVDWTTSFYVQCAVIVCAAGCFIGWRYRA